MTLNQLVSGTAVDWVHHHSAVKPKSIALENSETGEHRTWLELEQRVGRLANGLRHRLNLKPGDRVVAIMENDIRTVEMQFACMRSGLIFAPLNFRLAAEELVLLCDELEPALILTDASLSDFSEEVVSRSSIEHKLIATPSSDSGYEALIDSTSHMPAPDCYDPSTVTHIFYTSGTTGKPKGAMITHSGLIWNAMNQVQFSLVSDPAAHVFNPLPLFHNGGFNSLVNPILFFGGKVTLAPRFDPSASAKLIGNPGNGITHLALPPIMYQMIQDAPEFAEADLSAIKIALIAGGKTAESLRISYEKKGVRFHSNYGSTETGPTVTSLDTNNVEMFKAGSCGQAVKHVELRLVDEAGKDVSDGKQGEIWVRGPAIIAGYWKRDISAAFTDEGWFRTGDVAYMDADGFLFLVDRIKDMYKTGAENVSSQEVESVLLMHPAIEDCAVIGVPDSKWGEVGLVVVCPAKGKEVTIDTVQEACAAKLARYKYPKYIELVDHFPRNVSGKISKTELRERFKGSHTA